jgi:hypothetical protein
VYSEAEFEQFSSESPKKKLKVNGFDFRGF